MPLRAPASEEGAGGLAVIEGHLVTNMVRIPFRVSARAARLIGRENVATSQGAVTELVKNAYDADASACGILFVRRHEKPPATLLETEVTELRAVFAGTDRCYRPDEEGRLALVAGLSAGDAAGLNAAFDHVLDLWIVDNGHGMSATIIEKNWMVIGTDMKEVNTLSAGGRVVTGAKGIGRFALDRLGQECELFSGEKDHNSVVHWIVDWGDFEGEGKIIGDVSAAMEIEHRVMPAVYSEQKLSDILPKLGPASESENKEQSEPVSFNKGTAIRISLLHDRWDGRDSIKLKDTLEALLPPRDRGGFNIYVYDHRVPDESGWIDNLPPDQFDYRLTAKVDVEGSVDILIERQEIDVSKIRASVFTLPAMNADGFRRADFKRGARSYRTTLRKLLNLKDDQSEDDYLAIGPFDFTLYFMKLANPTADNLLRYPQKMFDVGRRRRWLRQSGGIRLYRDQFRVRPYGEPNTQGSDWLLLGQRVAANPAAARRLDWRVPPQQVAGTIHITKATNPLLSDQSNREGIMNERAFATFRDIILGLIREFERDRSYILNNFSQAYDQDNLEQKTLDKGHALADEILAKAGAEKAASRVDGDPDREPAKVEDASKDDERLLLAAALKSQTQRTTTLEDNVQVLRGMATLGTVLVSFTHELKQIKANMEVRQTRMENALKRVVDMERLRAVPEQVNPFNIVKRWGREDEKISRWVDFALASVSPAKRRRRRIDMAKYLVDLVGYWQEFTASKQIELVASNVKDQDFHILAHEIDLDSIFYNLIINSIEAFALPSDIINRQISIALADDGDDMISITYRDNGPGLSGALKAPEEIFLYGSSSKSNRDDAEVTGTGIGMWLLKTIVDDYQGRIASVSAIGERGFSISFSFPKKDATA